MKEFLYEFSTNFPAKEDAQVLEMTAWLALGLFGIFTLAKKLFTRP